MDLEAVVQLKEREPQTIDEVRALLGFLSYYHSFILDFARLARPLFWAGARQNETPENSSVQEKERQSSEH